MKWIDPLYITITSKEEERRLRHGERMRALTTTCLGTLVLTLVISVAIPGFMSLTATSEHSGEPTLLAKDPSWSLYPLNVEAGIAGLVVGKTLTIAMSSDIQTMDPAKTSTMYGPPGMIYETLIARDKTGAYVPGLAESWEMKDMRGTGYPHNAIFNITLKQGVIFHDGSPFNSYAVKRIINYYADNWSWVQYEFWSVYGCQNKTGWPDAGIWCSDDYHVTLNLTWTDVALTFNFSTLYGSMISPDALESEGLDHYGTPGHKVVGTGPFILKEWVPGDHVTLVKNQNYTWGASWYTNKGPAKIDTIIYRIIADEATRFAGFESGSIDVLQQVPPNKVQGYAANPDMTVITGPGQGTYHVDFNCQKAPWTNVSLRKAFGYAMNRTQILQSVWHGYGEEGVNYLSPIEKEGRLIPAQYNFSYDVVKSKALFLQAGYNDTNGDGWLENSTTGTGSLTLHLWTTNKGEDISMSEIVQQQFQAVGVHIVLAQYSEDELRSRVSAGEHDSVLFWYSWPRAEILDWEFGTWAMGGSNMAWFSDPVFDNFVTNWTLAETEQEFSDNATAGHIRLLTQAPRAPILFWHQIDAIHNNVTGWYVHPYGQEQVIDIVDVDVNAPPVAIALVTPNPAMAGEIVTFDASGSSDDVGVVNWTWTFMDGSVPVTLWDEVGTYAFSDAFQSVDVTLIVRDGQGNTDTATVTLDVVGSIPEFPTFLVPVTGTVIIVALIGLGWRFRQHSSKAS